MEEVSGNGTSTRATEIYPRPTGPIKVPEPRAVKPPERRKATAKLSQANFYKLCCQVTAHEKEFAAEGITQTEGARRLSKALGFTVTRDQVRNAIKTTGSAWTGLEAGKIFNRNGWRTRSLASFVAQLADKLGVEVPTEIKDIIRPDGVD